MWEERLGRAGLGQKPDMQVAQGVPMPVPNVYRVPRIGLYGSAGDPLGDGRGAARANNVPKQ